MEERVWDCDRKGGWEGNRWLFFSFRFLRTALGHVPAGLRGSSVEDLDGGRLPRRSSVSPRHRIVTSSTTRAGLPPSRIPGAPLLLQVSAEAAMVVEPPAGCSPPRPAVAGTACALVPISETLVPSRKPVPIRCGLISSSTSSRRPYLVEPAHRCANPVTLVVRVAAAPPPGPCVPTAAS